MQLIHIDVNTMRQALSNANSNNYIQSIATLMDEGFVVQIIQEYVNAPTNNLFKFNSSKEFGEWVENGCPSTWEKK